MAHPDAETGVSADALRAVMRRLPSPVTVVTTACDGEVRGITIGSFTSASLEPALVTFNVSRKSPMLGLLERAEEFVVHFLRDSQSLMSEHFAVPDRTGQEQFATVEHTLSANGVPLIDGVLARLSCSVEAVYDAGDHAVILGLVRETAELSLGKPLLYFDRGYRSVD